MTSRTGRPSNVGNDLVRAAAAGASAAPDLGQMPEWNLADLYAAPDAPEFKRDCERARADAAAMKARYQGQLAALARDPAKLAEAVTAYEALSDLLGRLGSYAGLRYAANQTDPARAKFYGDTSELLTNVSADLIFFELELNQVPDDVLGAAKA